MRALCFLLLILSGLPASPASAEWYRERRDMMGTRVEVELWAEAADRGEAVIEQAMAALQEVNRLMNPWDPESELALVNRQAHRRPVPVSAPVFEVVDRALYYSRLSDGAFDISFASVGQYYDYREGQAPDEYTLAEAVDKIDYRAIRLDAATRTIAFDVKGMQIDLGGVAKGYAVDRAIAVLVAAGIEAGVVSAGGDSRILGDLGDRPRTIGIRHPRRDGEFAVMIPLADTAISTSGDYERFFIDDDGARVHHILNPSTGKSSGAVQSATVLAARAIDSDALSTTTFVLGVEQGLALVNRLPGVDAIVIDAVGKLHYSEGLLREQ